MAVVEALTEEEKYLICLLQDESGIDQAEFLLYDEERDDRRWRAWPFQWRWYRCNDQRQISASSRSCGKSSSLKLRALAFPFLHPQGQMLITAPEGIHLNAITIQIENMYNSYTLLEEMLSKTRKQGITHRPFDMVFANGAEITGRIPQISGKGLKGMHPLWLEMDEAQDMPEAAWKEIFETLKRGHHGAVWRAHGVTRGVRDDFNKFSQPENGWTVWNFPAMWRPTWTTEERDQKIQEYGSKDAPDYIRNILGRPADEISPIFVLNRLMAVVDDNQSSDYNESEYVKLRIVGEELEESGVDALLDFNYAHISKYKRFWLGADIGWVQSPTEILVFAEVPAHEIYPKKKKSEDSALKLLMRVQLLRAKVQDQAEIFLRMTEHYKPVLFCFDSTGAGQPLYDLIQHTDPAVAKVIKGYNFAEKIVVDIDSAIEVDEYKGDLVKEAGIKREVLEISTDRVREFVDGQRIRFPWDKDIISQFQGANWVANKSRQDHMGRRRNFSKTNVHILDATRMAVLGFSNYALDEFLKGDQWEPIIPIFL